MFKNTTSGGSERSSHERPVTRYTGQKRGHKPQKINNPYQESLLIEAQATYYPNMVQIFIPKQPIVRTIGNGKTNRSSFPADEGLEYVELSKKFDEITRTLIMDPDTESYLERSLRRSKKRIGDYILCNDFDMFATFTINSDRQNNERSKKKVLGWLKNQRARNGKFRYLVVPEFHRDKVSLHFHALLGNYPGGIERAINPKTNKPLMQKGKATFRISGYTLGYTNVKLIGTKQEDKTRLSAYLKKYITKDMPVFEGKQRYWVSKGLALPSVEDNPEHWYKHVVPDWQCETPNGTLLRFDLNKNLLTDMFWDENGRPC